MPTTQSPSLGRSGRGWAACLLAFLVAFAVIYAAGLPAEQPASRFTATAAVVQTIRAPVESTDRELAKLFRPDPALVKQWLLSDSNLERVLRDGAGGVRTAGIHDADELRHSLKVAVQRPSSNQLSIAIHSAGETAQGTVAMANRMASQYAEDYRARAEALIKQRIAVARQTLADARRRLTRAESGLEVHLKAEPRPPHLPAASAAAPPQPERAVNPAWTQAQWDLESLQRRRSELLLSRTPLHPDVVVLDRQIAETGDILAATPRWIADESAPAPRDNAADSAWQAYNAAQALWQAKQRVRRSLVARARAEYDASAAAAERCQLMPVAMPAIEVRLADGSRVNSTPFSGRLLLLALASGLVAAAAVNLVRVSRTADRPLRTVEEVEAALRIPVAGTLSLHRGGRAHHSA